MDKNTEQEMVAVDAGVQDALPKDARWHRREARRLLGGKSGLTNDEKVKRMNRSIEHLMEARDMLLDTMVVEMQTGEI